MSYLRKVVIFGIAVGVMFLSPLRAQTPPSGASSGAGATNSTTPPSGQAPEDVLAKLSVLIHSGKYAEAQQLTAGLLVAYPDDQRLTKAKLLLDKMVTSPDSSNPPDSPSANGASAGSPTPATPANHLTGMDKVEYDSLIELTREAQQNTDLAQQKALLQQFMDRSGRFLQKHPEEIFLWQIRAASAVSLDDALAGYEAGQKLLAAGAADSNDPNLRQLLTQLNLKGWLDKQQATLAAAVKPRPAQSEAEKTLAEGIQSVHGTWRITGFTAEAFTVVNQAGTEASFRYDQLRSTKLQHYLSWPYTYVVLRGNFPSNFGWTASRYPNSTLSLIHI